MLCYCEGLTQRISIHALTGRATSVGARVEGGTDISIHALTGRATVTRAVHAHKRAISIHALTGRATWVLCYCEGLTQRISIHALTGRATADRSEV